MNYRRAGLNKDAVDARNSRPAFHWPAGVCRDDSAELQTYAALRDTLVTFRTLVMHRFANAVYAARSADHDTRRNVECYEIM